MLQPKLAESLIDYRYNWLRQPKERFEHGYQGAMYPWESSDSGFEETPVWAWPAPLNITFQAVWHWQHGIITVLRKTQSGWPKKDSPYWRQQPTSG